MNFLLQTKNTVLTLLSLSTQTRNLISVIKWKYKIQSQKYTMFNHKHMHYMYTTKYYFTNAVFF